MKPGFSFNDAVAAPFVLLRRRPFHLFVWGLMMMAVIAAMYSLFIPLFATIAASGGREAAPLWPGPGLLFYVSLYTSDRGSGSAGLGRSAGFWMGRGLHRGPLPQPTAGAPAGGRTNCEGEARGLGARSGGSEKKRKYLLNKTKHVSVPFFRLC